MAPPVCKYFLKGECKFGDRCKFDHPRGLQRNENRFATFQPPEYSSRDNYGRGNNDGRLTASQSPAFSLNKDIIVADLSTERPQWILSAYGPGSKAPAQLFGGPVREQSFEEMHLHHYKGVVSGNPELAIQQASVLVQEAELQMRHALNNVDEAMDFIRKAENEHPNRNDICMASAENLGSVGTTSVNPFAVGSALSKQPAPDFGQPSVLSTKPSPFNASKEAFGQPSMAGSTGVFGQTSALGQKSNPFGVSSGGAFQGQGTGNTIGPFPTFAGTSHPSGTLLQPTATNPFEQTSSKFEGPFSLHTSQAENPFTPTGARPNPFGPPTGQSQPSPFALAATSTSSGAPSLLAQKDPFRRVQQPTQDNPIGPGLSQALPSNPFGQQKSVPQVTNPFGQSGPTSSLNAFAHQSSSSSNVNSFSLSSEAPQSRRLSNAVSQDPKGPNAQYQHPLLLSYASKDDNHRLKMFKGKPVVYKHNNAGIQNRDGTWEKIWFPDGAPPYYGATEMDHDTYTANVMQAYLQARETGYFKDGVIPSVPPRREWCLWDF